MTITPASVKRVYTRRESAVYLGVAVSTIDRLIARGELVARKRAGRTYLDVAELDRYFERMPAREPGCAV